MKMLRLSHAIGFAKSALAVSITLVFMLFTGSAAAVSENVRVLSAIPDSSGNVVVRVHAKDLGVSPPNVKLHYNGGSGTWYDASADSCSDQGTHFICVFYRWSSAPLEFAAKYDVGGNTYWDNNDYANYKVSYFPVSGYVQGAVGYNVGLQQAAVTADSPSGSLVTINVAVQNLSYNKRVGARFRIFDGSTWWSWQDVDCSYNSATGLVETWRVLIGQQPRVYGSKIQFALYYKNLDSNTEYWDNNFSQDYVMSLYSNNVIY